MPRKTIEGAGATRDQLFQIARTLGYNKAAFSRATGLSTWKSRQLVNNLRQRKPIAEVLGKRNPEKKLAEYRQAVDTSGYTFRKPPGQKTAKAIPPEPRHGDYAKKLASRKFANATRTSYKYEPGKRIPMQSDSVFQIRAKGKGRSQGKDINELFSSVGDWTMAWAMIIEDMNRTGFTANDFEVIAIRSR